MKDSENEIDFVWGREQAKVFETLKKCLTEAPVLSFPDYTKEFVLATDASNVGIGACLMQRGTKRMMPIAYASRLLNPAERNYSVTDREALTIVWGLRKF